MVQDSLSPLVALPKTLTVRSFEETLYRNLAPRRERQTIFDLSACTYIEPPVLLYLLAVLTDRISRNYPSLIRLPNDAKVIHFLSAWKFANAFSAATGRDITEFLDKNGNTDLNIGIADNPYAGRLIDAPYGVDRLLSNYYFEINTFRNQQDLFSAPFALDEATKWNRVAMVLDNVLRGPSTLLASRIVYEALVNAIRHPDAEVIQLVSYLRRSGRGNTGTFVITFWDDGKPIASTLHDVVMRGGTIRPASDLGLSATYDITLQEGYGRSDPVRKVTSEAVPGDSASEEDYLLASVFPGTTSNPRSHVPVPQDFKDDRSPTLSQPGMGLYLLTNTAVSVYGGEVFIRSGRWRLKLNPGSGLDHYVAHLRHYKRWPPFHGNLITVRIPLQPRHDSEN